MDTKEPAKIVKGGENFYYCSECKCASNVPSGIPHGPTCSYVDVMKGK